MSEVFLWKDISAAEDKDYSASKLPLAQTLCWQSPRATLGCSDSLEGLTGLRKALTLTVIIYYHRRIQIKVGKGKKRQE